MTGAVVSALSRGPSRIRPVLAACLIGLLFSLQQVVIAHGFGGGMSLGAMAIRAAGLGISAWALCRHGVPRPLRLPLLAAGACLAALVLSAAASDHGVIAAKFAARYATELILLWALLNLALARPALLLAAAEAVLVMLWANLLLAALVRLGWEPALHLSLAFHPAQTFEEYLPRVSGFYEHPALLGAMGVIVGLMAVQLHAHGVWGRRQLGMACAGAVAALLLSGERNPLVPLALLAAWQLRPHRGRSRPSGRRTALLTAGAVAGLAFVAVADRIAQLTSALLQEGPVVAFTLGRTYIWEGAWRAWLSRPWFGLGAGVFQFLTPDFTGGRFNRGELHAHNLLLGVLSETGLCGLAACLFLLYALWRPWLAPGGDGRGWAMAWLTVLLGMGIFDFYEPFYGFAVPLSLAIALLYLLYPAAVQRTAGIVPIAAAEPDRR